MRVRDMQGTPAHIETIKTNDGIRRHPAYCIYATGKGKNRICTCQSCGVYKLNCHSAKHCDHYEQRKATDE